MALGSRYSLFTLPDNGLLQKQKVNCTKKAQLVPNTQVPRKKSKVYSVSTQVYTNKKE